MEDGLTLQNMILGYAMQDGKLSDREIARRCGCSQPYVSKVLNKSGIERNTRIDWDSFKDSIELYYQSGYSKKQIAEELEIPYCSLAVWMINHGMSVHKNIKPIQAKREHGKEYYDSFTGKIFYDFTDFFIDRPCICSVPQWKINLQNGIRNEVEDEFFE